MKRSLVRCFLFFGITAVFGSPADRTGCHPIDLSHSFDENTIYWTNMKPFRFTKKIFNDPDENGGEGIFYTANDFEAGEHGGTHLDAPYHFNKRGWKIGDIPYDRLALVNGILMDATMEAASDPNYALTSSKLATEWERIASSSTGEMLTRPTVILINFGWAEKYHNKFDYFGSKTLNITDLHYPGISHEAAEWIAQKREVVGVGLDTPSADSGPDSINPQSHVRINGANKYILENLDLRAVSSHSPSGFKLSVSPMKIKEGSGAPCRVFLLSRSNGCHI